MLNIINAPDPEAVKADLVEFLKALTDERVRIAAAPFDHPQIFVPNGHPGDTTSVVQLDGRAVDALLEVPATGGRAARPARVPGVTRAAHDVTWRGRGCRPRPRGARRRSEAAADLAEVLALPAGP